MKNCKPLLVYLSSRDENAPDTGFLPMAEKMAMDPPLGLWYLKAVSEKAGYRTAVWDQRLMGFDLDRFIADVRKKQFTLIGFYDCSYGAMHQKLLKYIGRIKADLGLPVIGGGPPSNDESSFAAGLDIRCHGEGEKTFIEILEHFEGERPVSEIKGISHRDPSGTITRTAPQSLIENLDDIPFPAIDPKNVPFYGNMFIVTAKKPAMVCLATRGCANRCTYCCSHTHWGNRLRKRSPENVVAELEIYARDHGARFIHFPDDILGLDEQWLMKLCDLLIQKRLGLTWICNLSPAQFDKGADEKLSRMKAAGCTAIHFGLQSADPNILEKIRRRPDEPERLAVLVKKAKAKNILTYVDFIFGLPGETETTMNTTCDWIMKHRPHYMAVWQLGVLEGSEIKAEFVDKPITRLTDQQVNDGINRVKKKFFRNPAVLWNLFWFVLFNNPGYFRYIFKLLPVALRMVGLKRMERHW